MKPLDDMYDPEDCVFCFRLVVTCHRAGGSGFGSGSGSGTGSEPIDEGLRDFITSNIRRGILESTLMIFESIKDNITELMEDRLRSFRSDMEPTKLGTSTLSFKDFRGCRAPDFCGVKVMGFEHYNIPMVHIQP